MADQPVQILNPVEALAAEEIRGLVVGVALKAALAAIEAQAPVLALPVIKPVFEFLATQLVSLVYAQLNQVVVFDIVDIRSAEEKAAYVASVNTLQLAIEKGDQSGIDQAKKDFSDSLARLIHFTP